ncbi:transmembrane protein 26-like [Saccostrea echinata]|uniref:transmembrane protein 26-like n=1 Tax=Saccostrea echinata TaxID=191078 RepID=UPI002A820160|nr:transmembrane protein 26-like [Saccostrea echinata]
MRCFTIFRALFVRTLFGAHGLIAIWRLYMVIGDIWCWYLTVALLGLLIETIVTLAVKRGKEWKWFCPSVFFYLASVVPAIWFLELHAMEERISEKAEKDMLNVSSIIHNITEENLKISIKDLGIDFSFPLSLTADLWLRVLEQFLLLMLIVGRWVLPKGALSHDQLSQLLLVYVGTAADIVEFYEAFNEEAVKYNPLLIYVLLGIWTLSLFQFTLVVTATRARRDLVGVPSGLIMAMQDEAPSCCNPEIYGIIVSILMQDCPFLVIRLLLIFYYHVVSYTNMFFTSKNSLVILLLLYRVIVIQTDSDKKKSRSSGSREKSTEELQAKCNREIHNLLHGSLSAPNVTQVNGNPAFRSFDSLPLDVTIDVVNAVKGGKSSRLEESNMEENKYSPSTENSNITK